MILELSIVLVLFLDYVEKIIRFPSIFVLL